MNWKKSGLNMECMKMPVTSNEIVVIGGGAAGMMAALSAAQQGAFVTLL